MSILLDWQNEIRRNAGIRRNGYKPLCHHMGIVLCPAPPSHEERVSGWGWAHLHRCISSPCQHLHATRGYTTDIYLRISPDILLREAYSAHACARMPSTIIIHVYYKYPLRTAVGWRPEILTTSAHVRRIYAIVYLKPSNWSCYLLGGECRTLWGGREQAMHYSIDCHM